MGALAFVIFAGYELARVPIKTLLVGEWGPEGLLVAWAAVAGAVIVAVSIYNRWAASRSPAQLMGWTAGVSAAVFAALMGAWHLDVPGAELLLYIWKDVYIVLLSEIFWTGANSAYSEGSARRVYGVFAAAGTIGAIAGAMTVWSSSGCRRGGPRGWCCRRCCWWWGDIGCWWARCRGGRSSRRR